MRLKITLESENEIILPLHYNKTLQGFIYSNLGPTLSGFLHDWGYIVNGKPLKPLTFSRIFGDCKINKKNKKLIFSSPIYFYFSSSIKNILNKYALNLMKREKLRLGKNEVFLSSLEIIKDVIEGEEITVKTISPIVVRKTVEKKSLFLSPESEEFYRQLSKNLSRKTLLHLKRPVDVSEIEIRPASGGFFKKAVVLYKGFPYEGYKGKFLIRAPKEAIETALLAGLGEKNAQGFGMVVPERR